MVRMGSYNLCDGFQELQHKIEQCHLAYLDMEESPEKLELRDKLEEYIHDFLCVTDHRQKFNFLETDEILCKSASMKKDFSAYKAAAGFTAIQLYAGNLIAQPWRKEYRQIKTYCGFYKHQIEANLVDAQLMFEALGYTKFGNGLLILDGPVCVDRAMAVSKDCLVAYVECQIIKHIWEEVSTLYKISWLDVLKFRSTHICYPENSIKALKYKYHERQYQDHYRSYSQGSDPFQNNPHCQPLPISNNLPGLLPLNNSFPPVSNHHHVGLPPAQMDYRYTNGYCNNSYGTYGSNYPHMSYSTALMKPCNPNGYCCNTYLPPPPRTYEQIVPTGKLIEVESHNGGSYDVDIKSSHKPRNFESLDNELYKSTKPNNDIVNNLIGTPSSDKKDSLEDWEYVYRNLESQGYTKDLGERGDLLSPNSLRRAKEAKKVKATNLDEHMNNIIVSNRSGKTNESFNRKSIDRRKKDDLPVIDKENSSASSYDNVEDTKQNKPSTSNNIRVTKSLPKEQYNSAADVKGVQNKDDRLGKKRNNVTSPVDLKKWQCKTCTFLNDGTKDICDMCCKSRVVTSEPPMEIGGAECPKCTLVNPKNLQTCQACDFSLENSPTYI